MYDLLNVLLEAKKKLIFKTTGSFTNVLKEIEQSDNSLILDWDKGAGEEWARFIHCEIGKVYMLNSRIGIIFVCKAYFDSIPQTLYAQYSVYLVDNFIKKEWYISLNALKEEIPEIVWHTSEDIINSGRFSLDDLYFATI